jgi:hypothetical protein
MVLEKEDVQRRVTTSGWTAGGLLCLLCTSLNLREEVALQLLHSHIHYLS